MTSRNKNLNRTISIEAKDKMIKRLFPAKLQVQTRSQGNLKANKTKAISTFLDNSRQKNSLTLFLGKNGIKLIIKLDKNVLYTNKIID